MSRDKSTHKGGCHCGSIAYRFQAPPEPVVQVCNCSICAMAGFLHLLVPKDDFHLDSGRDNLSSYRFKTETADHLFCKTCGVKSFYVPRSNPNGYSINMNCVELSTFEQIIVEEFDGQNWEANAASLSHLA